MRIQRTALAIIAALVLAGAAGCSSTRTQRAPGEHLDDAVLLTRVKTALIADETTKARHINVEVHRAVVQLNGFVDSAAEKSRASAVASGVEGVREVRNNLVVKPEERSAGVVMDDALLTAKVKTALIQSGKTKAHQITVKTEGGVVQLSGFVDSPETRAEAEKIAASVTGVQGVNNALSIKTP